MINARVETLAHRPAFRRLLAANRCLVPASGFFEFTLITAETNDVMARLHHRLPVIMARELEDAWRNAALAKT